jgi:hypothetical protein
MADNEAQRVYAAEEDGHLVLAGCTFTNDDLERFSQDNPTLSFDLRDPESYPASP